MKKLILVLCIIVFLILLVSTVDSQSLHAFQLTPFIPTNTPTFTPTKTPTIFIQPWRTNTPTPTKTPNPDCGTLIYCTPTPTTENQ